MEVKPQIAQKNSLWQFVPTQRPALVLAPMQAVTDISFMRVLARRGAPDWFVTEYFRVHAHSRLDRHILRSITHNDSGRPIFAQLIGSDPHELKRAACELFNYPIAGIDLNLGCPAPIVCRKDAGGGLLRKPELIKAILGELRQTIPGLFTVKTRLGFAQADEFEALLQIFQPVGLDGLAVHARTVADGYSTAVQAQWVARAVEVMACPVSANGNIVDVPRAMAFHAATGAAGLMIGRGAIRNPWIFAQLRQAYEGQPPLQPTRRELLCYFLELSDALASETRHFDPLRHVQRMKKTLVYVCDGLGAELEMGVRRASQPDEMENLLRAHLDNSELLPACPPPDSRLFRGLT